jgi:hypothetical protein
MLTEFRVWGVAQLPSMCEPIGLIPSTTQENQSKAYRHIFHLDFYVLSSNLTYDKNNTERFIWQLLFCLTFLSMLYMHKIQEVK